MLQITQKWCVTVVLDASVPSVRFYISDNHPQNVLQAVSKMDFDGEVSSILIERVAIPSTGTYHAQP